MRALCTCGNYMYVRERNAIQLRNPGIPLSAENGCLFLLFNLAPIVIVETMRCHWKPNINLFCVVTVMRFYKLGQHCFRALTLRFVVIMFRMYK